eukprot:g72285.t1
MRAHRAGFDSKFKGDAGKHVFNVCNYLLLQSELILRMFTDLEPRAQTCTDSAVYYTTTPKSEHSRASSATKSA